MRALLRVLIRQSYGQRTSLAQCGRAFTRNCGKYPARSAASIPRTRSVQGPCSVLKRTTVHVRVHAQRSRTPSAWLTDPLISLSAYVGLVYGMVRDVMHVYVRCCTCTCTYIYAYMYMYVWAIVCMHVHLYTHVEVHIPHRGRAFAERVTRRGSGKY